LYRECRAGAQIIFPKSGRGLGHVTPTIFGSTVGYPSDSLDSCFSDCVEKLDVKCGGGGAKKNRRRVNRSVDDFDSTEIRLGKSAKFDGAGVYTVS